jgi:hypothetical protein
MTFSITLGWWLVPFVATLTAYVFAFWSARSNGRPSYPDVDAAVGMFLYGAATILSLAVWLVWAVLA